MAGEERSGQEGHGLSVQAGKGEDRLDGAWQAWRGVAWTGPVGSGQARQGRRGLDWVGKA